MNTQISSITLVVNPPRDLVICVILINTSDTFLLSSRSMHPILASFCCLVLSFFFSSRRRHTRSLCDWSSDVCSSDLSNDWNWLTWNLPDGQFTPIVRTNLGPGNLWLDSPLTNINLYGKTRYTKISKA